MKNILLLLLIPAALFGQSSQISNKDVKELARTMAGSFSSEAQSKLDSDFYHITLRMTPLWKKEKNGYWLYVEQATAAAQDKPYRQRLYHVYKHDDTTIASKVYEIKDPKPYVNAWKDQHKLKSLTRDQLVDRQGCAIYLHKDADGRSFSGSTPGKECLSSLRGATYATSEVVIYKDKLLSWDRGWDADGKQVWGAVKSGYVFVKE